MNFSSYKRKNFQQIDSQDKVKVFQKVQRTFQCDFVCKMILNHIISKSQDILSRKQYLNKMIDQAKCRQSQKFAKNNCGSVLQNYFVEHQCLPPKMIYETSPNSPIKSPHSFLNYEELVSQSQLNDVLEVKRQAWEKRRDSGKIYNCNKIFVVKKSKNPKDTLDDSLSFKNITLNHNSSQFAGRYSHKTEIKKISINHNVFVPRLSNKGRLTVNPFPASTRSSPKNTFFLDSSENNRSSIFQSKKNTKNQIDHNKLVKIELNKRNSDQKSFKTIQNEKQTNSYITYLRDRKEKLQNIMKDFDQDQIVKKNQKIDRDVLMRQSKTENLAETYSKVPTITTDFNGNIMRVHEPRLLGQVSQLANNGSQTRIPRYQINNQGVLNNNVAFKIKDIDDQTRNFLNQIFSSIRATPSKSGKKIAFNVTQTDKKNKEKIQHNQSSKISLNYDQKDDKKIKIKAMFQPSIKTFQISRPKILLNGNQKSSKSILKSDLRSLKKNFDGQLNKQNDSKNLSVQTANKSINIKGNLRSQPTQRQNKKIQSSLGDLAKIYREQYNMKKERIHPKLLNNKKSIKTIRQSDDMIKQLSNQNFQKDNMSLENPQLKNVFNTIFSKFLQ